MRGGGGSIRFRGGPLVTAEELCAVSFTSLDESSLLPILAGPACLLPFRFPFANSCSSPHSLISLVWRRERLTYMLVTWGMQTWTYCDSVLNIYLLSQRRIVQPLSLHKDSKSRSRAAFFPRSLRSPISGLEASFCWHVDCHPQGTGWGPGAPFGTGAGKV